MAETASSESPANHDQHGNELFVGDGTVGGTQLVADLYSGKDNDGNSNSSYPSYLVEFKGKLYFTANDGKHGNELFVSDGTGSGTQLLADLNPGEDGSYASNLTVVGDELFFGADNGETGTELFKLTADDSSDGTSASVTITGSEGDDLFVLQTGEGCNTIFEFDLGSDRFGLGDGLQFDDLNFSGNNILAGGEVIASIEGVNAEQLTCGNFQTI